MGVGGLWVFFFKYLAISFGSLTFSQLYAKNQVVIYYLSKIIVFDPTVDNSVRTSSTLLEITLENSNLQKVLLPSVGLTGI